MNLIDTLYYIEWSQSMIEQIDTKKKIEKQEFEKLMKLQMPELSKLQRECQILSIPVIIVVEGFSASGKGTMIAKLIEPLDPRGFCVYATRRTNKDERKRPFLWRFFTKTPAKGRIAIFDRSWYTKVLRERFENMTKKCELEYAYSEINQFEHLLVQDGTVILKFFLCISRQEQKRRFKELEADKNTAWRVTKRDWEQNKKYKEFLEYSNEMLQKTDEEYAPWTIVETEDERYGMAKIYDKVISTLSEECEKRKKQPKEEELQRTERKKEYPNGVLAKVDLTKELSKEEYKKKRKELQKRLSILQDAMYLKEIPAVIVFEGWDAAGKGGAIRRLTKKLDPRAYEVVPISAPTEAERAHHYLWRFYEHIPEAGHLTIFDRSWYGRVMVERIEGFSTPNEWNRAYGELNFFEEQLYNEGAVVLKFWLHIDKDTQEQRFKERQETPNKQWKITEEDWRNRSKWNQYEEAVDEMLLRTSTTYAPWIVVEANSKYYARIKVLETVVEAFEKHLKDVK